MDDEKLERHYSRNIIFMYVAAILFNNWLTIPINLLYLIEMGVSYSGIAWLEIVNCIAVLVIDIPSGSFADKVGRKRTVILAYVFWGMALVLTGLFPGYWTFMVSFVFYGISEAASSGATSALIYDSLVVQGRENEYVRVESRIWFFSSISLVVGSIAGGFSYGIMKSLPWVLSGVLIFAGAGFIFLMKEPPLSSLSRERGHGKQIKVGYRRIRENKRLRFLIFYSTFLIIPIVVFGNMTEQPYLVSLGYDYVAIGILFAISRGVVGALNLKADYIERRLGWWKSIVIIHIAHIAIFTLLATVQAPWIVVFLFLAFFLRDYYNIITKKYINQEITSDLRATIISFYNEVFNVFYSVMLLVVAYVFVPIVPMLLFFVLFLCVLLCYLLKGRKRN